MGDMTELVGSLRLAIAALGGLGVGLEREWSAHARGGPARFAGLRTFFMLGLLGGCVGLFLQFGRELIAAALGAAGAAMAVAAYVMTERRRDAIPDATTEVAALVVIALGILAGLGWLALAGAATSIIVLALAEKERLHSLVQHLRADELRGALRFAVLALVVLPLLPADATLATLHLRPRSLWVVVLFFCALNFAAFVLRRAVGVGRGLGVAGMLGGLISSTIVTLDFSRRSRREPALAQSMAFGVIGACTVLIPRVLVVSAAFNPRVSLALLPLLLPVVVIGGWVVWRDWGASGPAERHDTEVPVEKNPLRLAAAIRMALAFQIAMSLVEYAQATWATPGLYSSAVVLGLTDVDALTVGMSRPAAGIVPVIAARAIAVGILANTAFKLLLTLTLGTPRFRRSASTGLAGMAAGTALALSVG